MPRNSHVGQKVKWILPTARRTNNTPSGVARVTGPSPLKGNHVSVNVSELCGRKDICLNGVRLLCITAWLKWSPDWNSTYWELGGVGQKVLPDLALS